MALKIAGLSCEQRSGPFHAGKVIADLGVHHTYIMGDTPYGPTALNGFGYTCPVVIVGNTATQFENSIRQMMNKPGWSHLLAARNAGLMRLSYMEDDHPWGDSLDHTVESSNLGDGPTGATTQAEINTLTANYGTALRALGNDLFDYPTAANLALNNGDTPAACSRESQTADPDWFPIKYHYVDYDFDGNLGGTDVRIICPDNIFYRSPVADTDDVNKQLWGTVQDAWIRASILDAWNSGFSYIAIMSTKKRFEGSGASRYGTGRNTDTFDVYTYYFDSLMSDMYDAGVRGLLMFAGDRHTPVVNYCPPSDPLGYELLEIPCCPSGVEHNTGQGNSDYALWTRSAPGKMGRGFNVFGMGEFNSHYAELSVRDGVTGIVRWRCRVAPRSATPYYV